MYKMYTVKGLLSVVMLMTAWLCRSGRRLIFLSCVKCSDFNLV